MLSVRRLASFACPRTQVPPVSASKLSVRASRLIWSVAAGCLLLLALGCNTYNPYLGATPTVSSSISSISPSATTVGHAGFLMTVTGSGFVAGSTVTWNNSSTTSTNLVSNVLSATEVQANVPAQL